MLELELFAMGCRVIATVDSEGEPVRQLLEHVPRWFADWQRVLSRFDPASELSRLNASGSADDLSPTLFDVLSAAVSASVDSCGLVTPTVLGALERAGYDRSFELIGSGPLPDTRAPMPCAPASVIQLDERRRAASLGNTRIDLGGFAKGWAADQVARTLGRLAPAVVDVGGDLAISAPRRDGSAWPIAIADPRSSVAELGFARVRRGGVATSGRDHRSWGDQRQMHHIIDPRTGLPAATDLLMVTVLAPSALRAEVAAKTVLILGSYAGLAWIEARPSLAALLVRDDGTSLGTLAEAP